MKKLLAVLALSAFTISFAQETPKKACCAHKDKDKKECTTKDKKDKTEHKDCKTKAEKGAKKSCCASKKAA